MFQEAGHHRGAADEGAEQGGEAGQAAGAGEATARDCRQVIRIQNGLISCSVVDPDPFVFGFPESGPFYDQANIVRKTLISTNL